MFVESGQNLQEWIKTGEKIRNSLTPGKSQLASEYSPEIFGIIAYIETLYSKWCPYDEMEWIGGY